MTDVDTGRRGAAVVLRALTLTSTGLALAIGGHVVGGGTPPEARLLVVLAAVVLVSSRPLARSTLRPAALLAWATGVQVAAHLALSWLGGSGTTSLTVPGHHGVETATGLAHHTMAPSATMLVAHLAATVLTVALLVGADRARGRVAAWWHALVALVTSTWTPRTARSGHAIASTRLPDVRHPGTDLLGRGPPRLRLA